MAKCKHKLKIELKWTVSVSNTNPYTKFLDSHLGAGFSDIQRKAINTGMRQTTWGSIVRDGGLGRNTNIFFDQNVYYYEHENRRDARLCNFNNLTYALRHINALVGEIPADARPTAVMSLKNYRSPVIQVDYDKKRMLLRKDAKIFEMVEPNRIQLPNVRNITFYGTQRQVYKVIQAFKLERRRKDNNGDIRKVLHRINADHNNSNWLVRWTDNNGHQFTWGICQITRTELYPQVFRLLGETYNNLELKYPERGAIHSDLQEVPL